jgi:hypothetical protein
LIALPEGVKNWCVVNTTVPSLLNLNILNSTFTKGASADNGST